jgi:hypothetical protein
MLRRRGACGDHGPQQNDRPDVNGSGPMGGIASGDATHMGAQNCGLFLNLFVGRAI